MAKKLNFPLRKKVCWFGFKFVLGGLALFWISFDFSILSLLFFLFSAGYIYFDSGKFRSFVKASFLIWISLGCFLKLINPELKIYFVLIELFFLFFLLTLVDFKPKRSLYLPVNSLLYLFSLIFLFKFSGLNYFLVCFFLLLVSLILFFEGLSFDQFKPSLIKRFKLTNLVSSFILVQLFLFLSWLNIGFLKISLLLSIAFCTLRDVSINYFKGNQKNVLVYLIAGLILAIIVQIIKF